MFDSSTFETYAPFIAIGAYFCAEAWIQHPDKEVIKLWFKGQFHRKK